jgi:hypothetical protein
VPPDEPADQDRHEELAHQRFGGAQRAHRRGGRLDAVGAEGGEVQHAGDGERFPQVACSPDPPCLLGSAWPERMRNEDVVCIHDHVQLGKPP